MIVYNKNIINDVFDDRILNYGPFRMNPAFWALFPVKMFVPLV